MTENLSDILMKKIISRALPDGGFPSKPGGQYRPDATAWAIMALTAAGGCEEMANAARARLAADLMEDGRVCLSKEHPQAFWPTALAVLAWHRSPAHRESQSRGIEFLLATAGLHWKKKADSPVAGDTALRAWSWIGETYSWVEPTALALLALEITGNGEHERAREARRMLMDRQMESGGWNYGNTAVFGRQLWPMPESTGLALSALEGRTERKSVENSISYLKGEMSRLRTPLSFAWGRLGLSAWGVGPELGQDSLLENFRRQEIYADHGTEQISLLIVSLNASKGLVSALGGDSDK
jgi:hypothetical protein